MSQELPTEYQKFIHLSRYARWVPELNRRETWGETVKRLMDFFEEQLKDNNNFTLSEKLRKELEKGILDLKIMPSMRALMTAGPALKRDHIASYNCCYVAVDDYKVFSEILYILMNGTGVGFSVQRNEINKLPIVPDELYQTDTTVFIRDSKLGWGKGLKEFISLLYNGHIPKWDVSEVRPAGAPLKTFGGRASGPEPLVDLFNFIIKIFTHAKGRKLNSLECHDIVCKIAEIVVVGGVRRSALISLSNLSDDRMRSAKSGQWWENNPQRALANNSVCYTEKPEMGIFMEEWNSIYNSKSGERGIFNQQAAQKQAGKYGRREPNHAFGCNPCQPSWATIFTKDGIKTLKDINIGDEIWSETGWTKVINKWSTGIKKVFKYRTSAGVFYGTENHRLVSNGKKVEAKDCESVDLLTAKSLKNIEHNINVVMDGLVFGDGSFHKASNKIFLDIGHKDTDYFTSEIANLIGKKSGAGICAYNIKTTLESTEVCRTFNRVIPDRYFYTDINNIASFLRGLYSANGSVVDKRVTLKTSSFKLVEQVQIMLSSLGISSYFTTNKKHNVQFKNGNYSCKESYDINISTDREKFSNLIGFLQEYKNIKLQNIINNIKISNKKPKLTYDIREVSFVSEEEVFDITVDNVPHTYWTGGLNVSNCSEILLRPKEFCNLTEVVVRANDDVNSLKEKIRLATILGTFQSTLTNFKFISSEYRKNCEEERLLGVSLTGIMDNNLLSTPSKELEVLLDSLRSYAVEVNANWANKLGINPSVAITCGKPSGTVSQLVDAASGIHARHAKQYIRTVRSDNKDPLCNMMKDAGFPWEPCVMKPEYTSVFSFPIISPDNCKTREDTTAIQQLELWLCYQNFWCEHKPSITVTVKDHEWLEVGAFVYKHFDNMSGVSFLPFSDHTYRQAPYTDASLEEVLELQKKIPKDFDWSKLSQYEKVDSTVGTQDLACSGNSCEIVDLVK